MTSNYKEFNSNGSAVYAASRLNKFLGLVTIAGSASLISLSVAMANSSEPWYKRFPNEPLLSSSLNANNNIKNNQVRSAQTNNPFSGFFNNIAQPLKRPNTQIQSNYDNITTASTQSYNSYKPASVTNVVSNNRPQNTQSLTNHLGSNSYWSLDNATRIQTMQGDTVSTIARRFAIPQNEIRKANNIPDNVEAINSGSTILLPTLVYNSAGARPATINQAPNNQINQNNSNFTNFSPSINYNVKPRPRNFVNTNKQVRNNSNQFVAYDNSQIVTNSVSNNNTGNNPTIFQRVSQRLFSNNSFIENQRYLGSAPQPPKRVAYSNTNYDNLTTASTVNHNVNDRIIANNANQPNSNSILPNLGIKNFIQNTVLGANNPPQPNKRPINTAVLQDSNYNQTWKPQVVNSTTSQPINLLPSNNNYYVNNTNITTNQNVSFGENVRPIARADNFNNSIDDITTSSIPTNDVTKLPQPPKLPNKQAKFLDQQVNVNNANNQVSSTKNSFDKLRWPLQGRIISYYGQNNITPSPNKGINIAAPEGTPIKSAEDGKILHIGANHDIYGNFVIVDHGNDYATTYAHAKEIFVKKGQHVVRGQTIASTGRTGNVTQPQLHFQVRKHAQAVDPQQYL